MQCSLHSLWLYLRKQKSSNLDTDFRCFKMYFYTLQYKHNHKNHLSTLKCFICKWIQCTRGKNIYIYILIGMETLMYTFKLTLKTLTTNNNFRLFNLLLSLPTTKIIQVLFTYIHRMWLKTPVLTSIHKIHSMNERNAIIYVQWAPWSER